MKKASQAIPNKLLVNERLQHQWSQKELAELVGTTTINVSRWERGITSPNSYFRHQLCILFGKSEEELGLVLLRSTKSGELSTEIVVSSRDATTSPLSLYLQRWSVPFQRNPLFTGREDLVTAIHQLFHSAHNTALRQTCVLNGLGGHGKTQIALEYAYRYQQEYQAVLWIEMSTRETLATSVTAIANSLDSSEKDELEPLESIDPIEVIYHWLQMHTDGLLILDNVEDMEHVSPIFSATHSSRILLTTRAQTTGMIASHLEIEQMEVGEGILFLLRRAKYIDLDAALEDIPESLCVHAEYIVQAMGGSPLALDQAGAYIEETGCGLSSYLSLYRAQSIILLHRRGRSAVGHPESIASTLLHSIEKVEKICPVIGKLLEACAFLDPDAISEDIITEKYASNANDPLAFDAAIAELRKYSLIHRDSHAKTLTIHRLTQVVLREKYAQAQPASVSLESGPSSLQASGTGRLTHELQRQSSSPKHQQTVYNPGALSWLFSPQSRHQFTTRKLGILLIGLIVLGSVLMMSFYPLFSFGKGQMPQVTAINSLAEEMKSEAQYFQTEGIGISDGNVIFDTYAGRTDVNLKNQAASCLQQGDTSCAVNFMTQAISMDVTDGETQIYNENLHIRQRGAPYVTVVLGLAIANTATYLLRARAIMQAAFLAQHEINTKGLLPNNLSLRILIDNSGSDNAHVATAAQFIANRVRNGNPDRIIAVLGWPFSSQTTDALDIIAGVRVPMISQTASSTTLSGSSPYFFRVNPTDSQQGNALGDVAVNKFRAKTILLVNDPTDPYSVSLTNAFKNRIVALNATVIHKPSDTFVTGVTSIDAYQKSVVQDALLAKVDLIFMAGYDVDAVRLAHALGNMSRMRPESTFLANLKIISGDAVATGLVLGNGGGPDAVIAARYAQDMQRLIFSSFAHPDEWAFENTALKQRPKFFSAWVDVYKNVSVDDSSIFQPGSHAILTFDALQVIVKAITLVQAPFTGETIRAGLVSLGKGRIPAFQGVSGLIAFNNQGDPIDKALVILDIESVNGRNKIVLKQIVGLFHQ